MNTLSHQAISKFGEAHQILKCIEELQELTIELVESLFSENYADMVDVFSIIRRANSTIEAVKHDIKVQKKDMSVEHLTRIVYEVADVVITLDQIMVIFNLGGMFGQAVEEKKDRLRLMIGEATP